MSEAALAPAVAAGFRSNLEHVHAELFRLERMRLGADAREINRLRAEIHHGIATAADGVRLRLPHLGRTLGLTPFEYDIVLLALAPELRPEFEPPTIEETLRFFCRTDDERLQARAAFHASARLPRRRAIELDDRPRLLERRIVLDARVTDFLLGGDHLDARLTTSVPAAYWITPAARLDDLLLPSHLPAMLARVQPGTVGLLDGLAGSGKRSAAEAWCAARGFPLLVFDVAAALHAGEPFELLLDLAVREALLYGAAVYLRAWDGLLGAEPPLQRSRALAEQVVAAVDGPVFIGSREKWTPSAIPAFVQASIPPADEAARQQMWTRALARLTADGPIDVALLARAFRLTPGRIVRAAAQMAPDAPVSMRELLRVCRAEAGEHLIAFAKATRPVRSWDDLVLPRDTWAQLHELCDHARQRQRVLGEWGFGARVSLGKGLIALFTGPSGTGKTLSAEVIATALGLDLYRIDLSAVSSKYIGETEKNLNRIFDDAERSSAILFFDEADSIFGRRTEVRDAHDRYANAEVNFMLQRVDEYEGIVILASNMSNNIDAAFLRRMHFVIEFPFPDEQQRARIWRQLFPRDAPIGDDLDFEFLARQFRLTGGSIRNVVLAAAFRAATSGGAIGMAHVVHALKREYQRQGRVCDRADFERYYELVR